MRVRWLRDALRSHDEEATHIAPDDPVSARLVVKRVLEAVATLVDQPALGRPRGVPGTHERVALKTRYVVPDCVRGKRSRSSVCFTLRAASQIAGSLHSYRTRWSASSLRPIIRTNAA